MYAVVLLTEEALTADDAARVVGLHPDELAAGGLSYRVLVPADTQRNLLVAVLDNVAFGEFDELRRDLADEPADQARAEAGQALTTTLESLRSTGAQAAGAITADDPLPALRSAVEGHDVDEVIVVTRPHLLEETFHRDWASRARRELGVPVLHVYDRSGGRVG